MTYARYGMICARYAMICARYAMTCARYGMTCARYGMTCARYAVICARYVMTCARYAVTYAIYAMTCARHGMTSAISDTTSYCCSLCCHNYPNSKSYFTKSFWVTTKRRYFQYTYCSFQAKARDGRTDIWQLHGRNCTSCHCPLNMTSLRWCCRHTQPNLCILVSDVTCSFLWKWLYWH